VNVAIITASIAGPVKNDPSIPPTDASAIQSVTPSDMFSWAGAERTFDSTIRAHRDWK